MLSLLVCRVRQDAVDQGNTDRNQALPCRLCVRVGAVVVLFSVRLVPTILPAAKLAGRGLMVGRQANKSSKANIMKSIINNLAL